MTCVREQVQGRWVNVTKNVLPEGIDLRSQFEASRTSRLTEVAPFIRTERRDGTGQDWGPGPRVIDLEWDGRTFQKRRPSKKETSYD